MVEQLLLCGMNPRNFFEGHYWSGLGDGIGTSFITQFACASKYRITGWGRHDIERLTLYSKCIGTIDIEGYLFKLDAAGDRNIDISSRLNINIILMYGCPMRGHGVGDSIRPQDDHDIHLTCTKHCE